ncbi:MAG: chemotaxis protein CheA [Hydrogenimonas sp.]|nr:MAG: chemotaxis protein CheA [Hydrogenimonas sp.]
MGIRTRLEEAFDYEIVDEFLDHFETIINTMEPAIIALEKEQGNLDRIHELFRMFHNIKSASTFLNIEQLCFLMEFVEDRLEPLRQNPHRLSERVIDWLLLISDQLRLWYVQIQNDSELGKINPKILDVAEREEL